MREDEHRRQHFIVTMARDKKRKMSCEVTVTTSTSPPPINLEEREDVCRPW